MRNLIALAAVLCTLLVVAPLCQAVDDDFNAMQREMAREMDSFQNEVDADFVEFRDERDREFAEYLREQWEAFDELAAEVSGLGPKPKLLPKKPDDPADKVKPQGEIVEPPPIAPPPAPVPVAPPITIVPPPPAPPVVVLPPAVPTPVTPPPSTPSVPVVPVPPVTPPPVVEPVTTQKLAQFDFYGQTLKFYYDPLLSAAAPGTVDSQTMSTVWENYSGADVSALLRGFVDVRRQWELNDWGYYLLVRKFAASVNKDDNGSELLTWFLLVKSGYECRIAYNEKRIFLLAPVKPILYGVPYLNIDGTNYFNLTCLRTGEKAGRLFSYRQSHAASINSFDLALLKAPRLTMVPFTRKLKFDYAGKTYSVPVRVNRQTLNFFNDYPSTDFPVFFEATVEPDSQSSLLSALSPLVAGKSETEAVNLLLRFVQTSLEYKTDEEQFGREKYLFIEETLFFPYCDCEDRSILFSYLVDRLVGLKTVGLLYPGHIAVGVQFNATVPGDAVLVDGERFVVCDPTYINADIGMAMPQFQKTNAEVIKITRPL